jgi:serine/threonine protein kinase
MGVVYRAKDTRLNRTVAIEVLPGQVSDRSDLRQWFEREARAASSLNHPHIYALYDIGHQNGIDYLVMEYLEGVTLALRLTKGALPLDQVLSYAVEIAVALDQAHRHGVVHRDLKPGDVMLTRSGAKLLDFGLAKCKVEAASSRLGPSAETALLLSSRSGGLTCGEARKLEGRLPIGANLRNEIDPIFHGRKGAISCRWEHLALCHSTASSKDPTIHPVHSGRRSRQRPDAAGELPLREDDSPLLLRHIGTQGLYPSTGRPRRQVIA